MAKTIKSRWIAKHFTIFCTHYVSYRLALAALSPQGWRYITIRNSIETHRRAKRARTTLIRTARRKTKKSRLLERCMNEQSALENKLSQMIVNFNLLLSIRFSKHHTINYNLSKFDEDNGYLMISRDDKLVR